MMATAVIDANVLIGLLDDEDKWHNVAIALCDALNEAGITLIYLDCVINEAISVLARRTYEQKRPEQLNTLLDQLDRHILVDDITWVSEEIKRLYLEIVSLIRNASGKLNFHDALIALYSREQGISFLVSFDRDFDELTWLTRVEQAAQVTRMLGDDKATATSS